MRRTLSNGRTSRSSSGYGGRCSQPGLACLSGDVFAQPLRVVRRAVKVRGRLEELIFAFRCCHRSAGKQGPLRFGGHRLKRLRRRKGLLQHLLVVDARDDD